jgi:hypothetical protein
MRKAGLEMKYISITKIQIIVIGNILTNPWSKLNLSPILSVK